MMLHFFQFKLGILIQIVGLYQRAFFLQVDLKEATKTSKSPSLFGYLLLHLSLNSIVTIEV